VIFEVDGKTLCQFSILRILKLVAGTRLLRWFNGGSDGAMILLFFHCFFSRSVGMLDTIICRSWLFAPTWEQLLSIGVDGCA
jgi:hypothetical protein